MRELTVGSLFAGIGGFELGFERAGMKVVWQVENDAQCNKLLGARFPGVRQLGDIREFAPWVPPLAAVNLVCGGDPCPIHSRARSNGRSVHPDLSGYFLAVVGRLLPEWVVRENVPAPTVSAFDAALAALGYRTCVVRLDAAEATRQTRQRDYIVGCHQSAGHDPCDLFSDCPHGAGAYTTRLGSRPVTPALTTHRTRYDSRDCYVWEPGQGLRILDGDERDRLAGFPPGWTAGFSEATRARMCGNAVPPPLAEWLGRRIVEVANND